MLRLYQSGKGRGRKTKSVVMNKELNRIFEEKFAPVLEDWAITFKLIGSPDETPRYSQIQAFRGEEIILKSTQKYLWYGVSLTEEEKELIYKEASDNTLWNLWKRFRTKYLLENHPTIDVY